MHQSNAGCQKQTNKMAYANSQEEQSTDKLVCNTCKLSWIKRVSEFLHIIEFDARNSNDL
jgi:hypothetical protein